MFIGVPAVRRASSTSCMMTESTITKRYGLRGQPCLIPELNAPLATSPFLGMNFKSGVGIEKPNELQLRILNTKPTQRSDHGGVVE